MKITQSEIDAILEMTTEELTQLSQLFQNVSDDLFLECVRYEIKNRHRVEARECSVN